MISITTNKNGMMEFVVRDVFGAKKFSGNVYEGAKVHAVMYYKWHDEADFEVEDFANAAEFYGKLTEETKESLLAHLQNVIDTNEDVQVELGLRDAEQIPSFE